MSNYKNKGYGGWVRNLLKPATKENPGAEVWADRHIRRVDNGVTANTGSTQATGYKIKYGITVIGTCANAGDSLTLPTETAAGMSYEIKNNGAASADVFPPVGGNIDGVGANTAVAVANTKSAKFVCTSYNSSTGASTWASFYTD